MVLSRDVIVLEDESWNWNEMKSSLKKAKVKGIIDYPTSVEEIEYVAHINSSQHTVMQRPQRHKQAPRAWIKKIDSYSIKEKFNKCAAEHGVYVKGDFVKELIIICLYVDDLLVTRSNPRFIDEFKKIMEAKFEMTDLGNLSYFLGIEFIHTTNGLMLHQKKYAGELLKRFNMLECNAAKSPMEANLKLVKDEAEEDADEIEYMQIIGSLRFLCNNRPDLAFSVGVINMFMNQPKKTHMMVAKRVLRYIKGTMDCGVLFPSRRKKIAEEITGYSNSDYGGDPVERKSTFGYIFMLNDALISWCSKKQPVVALSSCEAEYIAGRFATCQGVWIKELMEELKMPLEKPIQLKIDNVSIINLAKNPVSHGRVNIFRLSFTS
ncbi:uncharacterized mitochondrial protein AtMg00810-like [Vigna umbellata]|uniref:uncharacterized mitochondrial protein AtMg00810-like n=1 Tax=Vigna umbellata TaxID=87088 RepID=UPI001F5F800D|nr:uncharacterized mitochondrial protein AtMg00810-like [Vigna umbellata]